jgi:hypothetical protein
MYDTVTVLPVLVPAELLPKLKASGSVVFAPQLGVRRPSPKGAPPNPMVWTPSAKSVVSIGAKDLYTTPMKRKLREILSESYQELRRTIILEKTIKRTHEDRVLAKLFKRHGNANMG